MIFSYHFLTLQLIIQMTDICGAVDNSLRLHKYGIRFIWLFFNTICSICLGAGISAMVYDQRSYQNQMLLIIGFMSTCLSIAVYFIKIIFLYDVEVVINSPLQQV
jgi:ABC-type sugar transport system permease subunit